MLFMNASHKQNYNVGHFTFLSCTLKFQPVIGNKHFIEWS